MHVIGRLARSFLVDGDEGVTLIDAGLPGRHRAVGRVLTSIGRSWSDVRAIALTHAHSDHAGGAAALRRVSSAPVVASGADAAAIRGEARPVRPPVFRRHRFLSPLFWLAPRARPVPVDHLVDDGVAGGLPDDIAWVPTPGHTPGHVSYLLERAGGVLFVGDAAVATRRGEVQRGWMNGPDPALDTSLRRIAGLDFEVALFAHSPPIEASASAAFRRFAATVP